MGRITTRREVLAGVVLAAATACDRSRALSTATPSSQPDARPSRSVSAAPPRPPVPSHRPASVPVTALPRPGLATVRARTGVPVLCYHQIREPTAQDTATARTYIVRPTALRAQLDELARLGYTTITPDQYYRHLSVDAALPPRPVLITFDDAAAGQWPVAVPALGRHRFIATFFVMTVVLGHRGWLTRPQAAQLARLGHTVAAHTWDHHPVTGYTARDWTKQLTAPVTELTRLTGEPVRYFAYPYGEWDRGAFPHLRAGGILAAWQLAGRPLDQDEPLLTLRRRIVAGDLDVAGFRHLLAHPST